MIIPWKCLHHVRSCNSPIGVHFHECRQALALLHRAHGVWSCEHAILQFATGADCMQNIDPTGQRDTCHAIPSPCPYLISLLVYSVWWIQICQSFCGSLHVRLWEMTFGLYNDTGALLLLFWFQEMGKRSVSACSDWLPELAILYRESINVSISPLRSELCLDLSQEIRKCESKTWKSLIIWLHSQYYSRVRENFEKNKRVCVRNEGEELSLHSLANYSSAMHEITVALVSRPLCREWAIAWDRWRLAGAKTWHSVVLWGSVFNTAVPHTRPSLTPHIYTAANIPWIPICSMMIKYVNVFLNLHNLLPLLY